MIHVQDWRRLRLACCLFALIAAAHASPSDAGATSRGQASLSITGGAGTAYGDQYAIVGAGGGYYLADGVQVGLNAEAWAGGDPSIYRISPEARYVLDPGGRWLPYLGGYYRHTFVEDHDDFGSVGGRAGVLMGSGGNTRLGVGVVYDVMLDCDSEFTSTCSQIYPELHVSVSF